MTLRLLALSLLSLLRTDAAAASKDLPPIPKWRPTVEVDIPRTARTMARYLDDARTFVIFTNGTCVVVSATEDPVASAKDLLEKILHAHPDMNTAEMDDGHWTVRYSQAAFSVVFREEIEAHWGYIEKNHLDGLTRDEVIFGPSGAPNRFNRAAR
jgi:hypothetical protein